MTRTTPAFAFALALSGAGAVAANGLDILREPHLDVVPRTAAEAKRVAGVVAPATDFDAPEPFEANSAGAATVRARTDADAFSLSSANMPFA